MENASLQTADCSEQTVEKTPIEQTAEFLALSEAKRTWLMKHKTFRLGSRDYQMGKIKFLAGVQVINAEEQMQAAIKTDAKRADRRRREIRRTWGLGGNLLSCSFENFELSNEWPKQMAAYYLCQKFVNALPSPKRGLMLHSPSASETVSSSGLGKSHLMAAVAKAGVDKPEPVSVFWANCAELDALQDRAKRDGWSLYERMIGVELLCLDDLDKGLYGNASASGKRLLQSVIHHLDDNPSPVLAATSNAGPAEWAAMFQEDAEWLYSRIMRLMYLVEMDGNNYRLKQADDLPYWSQI